MLFKSRKKYTVYTAGAPILRKKAREVKQITPEIVALGEEMVGAMRVFEGIGLAGPQYGSDLRIVAFDVPMPTEGFKSPGEALMIPQMPMVVVNPEIVAYGQELVPYDEGCLSVPEIYGEVVRPQTVKFRAQRLDGSIIECECDGLLARCIQHELDHLDGLLFVDRMTDEEFAEIESDYRRLEKSGAAKDYKRKA